MNIDSTEILELFTDAAKWCEAFLRDPNDKEEPLKLRKYQRDVIAQTRKYRRIILRYGRRMGKCLRGNSLIVNSLGELVKVNSLVNKERFSVVSLDDKYRFDPTYRTKCVSNGIKPIYRLVTKSGRRIDATENHPFLTPTGWRHLGEIKSGDNIAVPSKIDLGIPISCDIFDFQAKTLAYLLSDGCITSYITFGNNIKCVQDEFKDIIPFFNGCTYRIIKKKNGYEEYYVHGIKNKNGTRGKNSLLTYLKNLGLFGKTSHTKFIPNEIMRVSKRQQALFLSRLFACDGWASVSNSNSKSGNCEIGYCSVSEDLAYGVGHLLTRFGIRYFITERNIKYNGTLKKAFQICIRTKSDILKFIHEIGIFGKEDACQKVKDSISTRDDKDSYFDSLPTEDIIDMFNIKCPRKYDIRKQYKRTSKSKFINYAKSVEDEGLLDLCNSDIFFDEIISVDYICDEETFDLEVWPYHNFIVNDIIVHNSVTMCADTLWWCSAYPIVRMIEEGRAKQQPFTVIIATPYETQIKELWNTYTSLIADSPLLREQIAKIRTSDIHTIEFDNGSIIKGYTIGISSSNRGTSLRGLSADMVFLDEMDFIPREIIEQVIMPIWTTHTECRLRICSTPSGKRELFYEWSTRGDELGWLSLHAPSWHPANTNWMSIEQAKELGKPITESTEYQVRAITSAANFEREYGAEFGEEFGGVYKNHLIAKSLKKYARNVDMSNPDIFDPGFEQNPGNIYIIGVDWNSYVNGGQIVMLEFCKEQTIIDFYDDDQGQDVSIDFTGKYRLFYRRGVRAKEATQRKTREEIIRLMKMFKVDYVYVDYGAGDTNIEELTYYGNKHPELQMNRKLKVIDSGASVEHYDPILGSTVKKRNKSMMINFSVLNLEEGMFVLPKEEDEQLRLVGQMRGYQVKNVTSRGDFSYEGEDHILDAFNLAVYGFQKEYGDLIRNIATFPIVFMNDPRLRDYPRREQEVEGTIQTKKQVYNTYSAIRDPEKPIQRVSMPKRITMPRVGSRGSIGHLFDGRSNF